VYSLPSEPRTRIVTVWVPRDSRRASMWTLKPLSLLVATLRPSRRTVTTPRLGLPATPIRIANVLLTQAERGLVRTYQRGFLTFGVEPLEPLGGF
jgi:hypothetical protein